MEGITDSLQEDKTALREPEKKDPYESYLEYCRETIFAGTLKNLRCVEKGIGIRQFYPKNQENMAGENGSSQDFIIVKIEGGNMRIIIQDIHGKNAFALQVESLTEWIEGLEKEEKGKIHKDADDFHGKRKIYTIPVNFLERKINGSNNGTIFSKVKKGAEKILHLLA